MQLCQNPYSKSTHFYFCGPKITQFENDTFEKNIFIYTEVWVKCIRKNLLQN